MRSAPPSGGSGAFHSGGVSGFHGAPVGVQHGGNFGALHGLGAVVPAVGSGTFHSGGFSGINRSPVGGQRGGNFGAFRSARVGSQPGSLSAWHTGLTGKRGPGVTFRRAAIDSRHEGDWRWHKGHWHNGYWHKGWWGPAFVTGAAAGAFATCPSYDGCWVYQPTYDDYGNYLGNQCVNVCR